MATPSLGFQNWFSTTLSSGITASDTTIYLNSLPTPSEGYLVLEPDSTGNREIIYYTSKGANYVTLPSAAAGRGVGGTTAVSHSSGVTVQMNIVAEHFEALQDGTAFAVGGIGASPYADGWTPILGSTPNTVTANGNRNYDLVFNSVDLSSTLSPGMKLKLTRTVAAPTKCTSLNGSTQYYNKTSPAGMTFTDDFVVSAWIKLSSYPAVGTIGGIVSRTNGTSGWEFGVNSNGALYLQGFNGGVGNVSTVQAYTTIPLNKWVHVAAQLDMSTFTATTTTSYIMIDGVDMAASVSRAGTNPTALVQAGNLEIGSSRGGAQFFPGKIAQVAIYNAKVTQATILASIDRTLTGSETSLISAYSFNNSINDLSANANNLTAQGSAVATNTDSPFANSSSTVTAGTLEYAEINAVTFSTNTTVNVRVPDTCQIPTTGGISSVYYSTQSNPYGLPAFSNILSCWTLSNDITTSGTSETEIYALVSSVYVPTGRRIKITLYGLLQNGAVNTAVNIWDGAVGGTLLTGWLQGVSQLGSMTVPAVVNRASGNKTYRVSFKVASASSVLRGVAIPTSGSNIGPTYMIVELV